jgi:hypothetical protein
VGGGWWCDSSAGGDLRGMESWGIAMMKHIITEDEICSSRKICLCLWAAPKHTG